LTARSAAFAANGPNANKLVVDKRQGVVIINRPANLLLLSTPNATMIPMMIGMTAAARIRLVLGVGHDDTDPSRRLGRLGEGIQRADQ
jgi:hypothetical protein